MGALIAAGAGAALGVAGGVMSGIGAKKEAKRQAALKRQAAEAVKLNYGEELSQSLKDIAKYSPQAQKQALAVGLGEQDILESLRERAAPGTKDRQSQILSSIDAYLRGELSPETQRAIGRSSAAQGAARFGSLGGSIPLRAEAAALGRATEQQQMMGMSALGQYQQLFPMAPAPTLLSFLGGGPQQTLARRSQEQLGVANILSGIQAAPSMWSSSGNSMSQIGGISMGAGIAGMGSGDGGGFGGFGGFGGGNGTSGYMGSTGGAQYYNVPTSVMR
jgi:hypothetical protein